MRKVLTLHRIVIIIPIIILILQKKGYNNFMFNISNYLGKLDIAKTKNTLTYASGQVPRA